MTRHQYEKLMDMMNGKITEYALKAADCIKDGRKQSADHFIDKASIWNEAVIMVIRADNGEL